MPSSSSFQSSSSATPSSWSWAFVVHVVCSCVVKTWQSRQETANPAHGGSPNHRWLSRQGSNQHGKVSGTEQVSTVTHHETGTARSHKRAPTSSERSTSSAPFWSSLLCLSFWLCSPTGVLPVFSHQARPRHRHAKRRTNLKLEIHKELYHCSALQVLRCVLKCSMCPRLCFRVHVCEDFCVKVQIHVHPESITSRNENVRRGSVSPCLGVCYLRFSTCFSVCLSLPACVRLGVCVCACICVRVRVSVCVCVQTSDTMFSLCYVPKNIRIGVRTRYSPAHRKRKRLSEHQCCMFEFVDLSVQD